MIPFTDAQILSLSHPPNNSLTIWENITFLKHNSRKQEETEDIFPVWLRNSLISARLEPVRINTENLCIVSYYRQFST